MYGSTVGYNYYYLLMAYSPVNRTGSLHGFSQVQILHKSHNIKKHLTYIYKTCTFYKRKTHKHNPKVSPFGIALVKTGK